jgi:hypothetical protein
VRAADGNITTFDVPGAGSGSFQGTTPTSIRPGGAITGYYFDANSVTHGFLRARHGSITTFDVPGAGTSAGQGTNPLAINPAGLITGWYDDANGVSHGFLLETKTENDENVGEFAGIHMHPFKAA